jgi:hypothetical protein
VETRPQSTTEDLEARRARLGAGLLMTFLVLTAASKSVLYDTLDPDFFWHVRVGEQLTRDGVGPIVDDLSFASIKEPWTPYSWLAELAMKAVWESGGLRAVVAAQSMIVAMFFTFVVLTCVERTHDARGYLGIALAAIVGGYLALPYFSFRPASMAYALLASCAWLLARDRRMRCRSRAVWLIVPITALLVNVHLFVLFVPIWVGLSYLGRRRMLLLLTVLACCATPMLPGVVHTSLHYSTSDPMVSSGVIGELRPFYAGAGMGRWITGGVLLGALVCVWRRRSCFGLGEWLCLAAMLVGLLRMGRLAPVFVIVFTPMLAAASSDLRGRILSRPAVCATLAVLIAFGVTRIVVGFPSRHVSLSQWLNRNGPDTPGYPCGAAAFVQSRIRPRSGRIINDFNSGGYLAFELGPRGFHVFMDPRTQLYTPQFWEAAALGDEASTANAIRGTSADAAIIPHGAPKLAGAVRTLGWKEVFRDDRATVYVPPEMHVDVRSDR